MRSTASSSGPAPAQVRCTRRRREPSHADRRFRVPDTWWSTASSRATESHDQRAAIRLRALPHRSARRGRGHRLGQRGRRRVLPVLAGAFVPRQRRGDGVRARLRDAGGPRGDAAARRAPFGAPGHASGRRRGRRRHRRGGGVQHVGMEQRPACARAGMADRRCRRRRVNLRGRPQHSRAASSRDVPAAARHSEQRDRAGLRVAALPRRGRVSRRARAARPSRRRRGDPPPPGRAQLLAGAARLWAALVAGVPLERCASGTGASADRPVLPAQRAPSR